MTHSMHDELERIRRGGLRGAELVEWIARIPPGERDEAVEALLGVPRDVPGIEAVDGDFVPYTPSGVAPVVRAMFDAPVTASDVLVDLGAGLGKVVLLAHLLSGARCRGVELQPELAERSASSARALGLSDVSFVAADARAAEIADGTVFFLYLPFRGAVLATVLERLRRVAERHPIVVCALGFELRGHEWLSLRPSDAFWLSVYDASPRGAGRTATPIPLTAEAEAVVFERAWVKKRAEGAARG
jgi:hypothetical protein